MKGCDLEGNKQKGRTHQHNVKSADSHWTQREAAPSIRYKLRKARSIEKVSQYLDFTNN